MPFGLKWTTGILGHYSEAWAIAPWLGAEVCGSWWKPVEAVEVSFFDLYFTVTDNDDCRP